MRGSLGLVLVLAALCCEPCLTQGSLPQVSPLHNQSQGTCSAERPFDLVNILKLINAISSLSPGTREKIGQLHRNVTSSLRTGTDSVTGTISMLEVQVHESPFSSVWFVVAGVAALGGMQETKSVFCSIIIALGILASTFLFVDFLENNRWFFEDAMGYDVVVTRNTVRALGNMRIAMTIATFVALVSLQCVSLPSNLTTCNRGKYYAYMFQWPVIILLTMGLFKSRASALALFQPTKDEGQRDRASTDSSADQHMFRGVNVIKAIEIPLIDLSSVSASPSPSPSLPQPVVERNPKELRNYRRLFPTYFARLGSYIEYSHMAKFGVIAAMLLALGNILLCV